MDKSEMISQIEIGIRYMKTKELKEKIQKSILKWIINEFQYSNIIQIELIDALNMTEIEFIDKYAQFYRDEIDESKTIKEILLDITAKESLLLIKKNEWITKYNNWTWYND